VFSALLQQADARLLLETIERRRRRLVSCRRRNLERETKRRNLVAGMIVGVRQLG
jgi:hypothetical protein